MCECVFTAVCVCVCSLQCVCVNPRHDSVTVRSGLTAGAQTVCSEDSLFFLVECDCSVGRGGAAGGWSVMQTCLESCREAGADLDVMNPVPWFSQCGLTNGANLTFPTHSTALKQ